MALVDRTTVEILTAICPSLISSGLSDIYIDIATEETSQAFFGNYYNYAIALRAAHEYTISTERSDGASGLITSRAEGRLQVSYLHNMTRSSKSDLGMTAFGQKLQSLIRSMGPIASISSTEFDLSVGVFLEADEDYF
jgi:hypothetical protein